MDSRWHLACTLGAGAVIGAGLCYACMSTSKPTQIRTVGSSETISTKVPAPGAAASTSQFLSDDIVKEQLTRNIQFFGMDGQTLISDAFVVVVGLGGVGSHAAHLLLRSGVRRLRLIDFDLVTLSSLNRHAVAKRQDVGSAKAVCLKKHFLDIMPEADIDARVEMYTADKEEELLSGQPTFVLDAIDNIDTKVALVAACVKRGIPVLSSAGAGAKADPTRLHVLDVGESSSDPLARALRYRLRKDHGIERGVPVLLSTEKPRCKLVASEEVLAAADPREYQIVPNFRVTTIPVLGTTPSVFGMAAAGWILCQLAGAPFQTTPIILLQEKQYQEQLKLLRDRELARWGDACPPVPIDMDDIIYLLRELWRGYSAKEGEAPRKPGGDFGLKRATGHLCLTRWDKSKPAFVDNLVLLTHEEADAHDASDLDTVRAQDPVFFARVERMLTKARNEHYY